MSEVVGSARWPLRRATCVSVADCPCRPPVDDIAISTGWWELDQIWRLYPGQFTVLTGIAGHGKSTFAFNLICNLARLHGTRSFMFIPENEGFIKHSLAPIWGNHVSLD